MSSETGKHDTAVHMRYGTGKKRKQPDHVDTVRVKKEWKRPTFSSLFDDDLEIVFGDKTYDYKNSNGFAYSNKTVDFLEHVYKLNRPTLYNMANDLQRRVAKKRAAIANNTERGEEEKNESLRKDITVMEAKIRIYENAMAEHKKEDVEFEKFRKEEQVKMYTRVHDQEKALRRASKQSPSKAAKASTSRTVATP